MMALRPALRVLLVATPLLVAASNAAAQWVWKDEAGQVIASDQPPPANVPQSRILKEPKARAAAAPVAPDATPKAEPAKTVADRELDAKQRQKEAAEAAKKADEEAVKAKALQENCTTVRGNLAALQAGGRAARFNEKGERVYIDDAQRAAEIAKSQGQVAQFCK